jgi:uracil phosphoribosyltransferase
MDVLVPLRQSPECSFYEIKEQVDWPIRKYVVSTPESRAICNDPFLVGMDYTNRLRHASEKALKALTSLTGFALEETRTTVLHILRGGLNFGLREALSDAFGWNRHSSAFISAQRARQSEDPEDWHITEGYYQKVYLAPQAHIVFGDVVATGTSLEFALKSLLAIAEKQGVSVRSVIFLTIGGIRAEEILSAVNEICYEQFPGYAGSAVVYFEGRFGVAVPETPVSIKISGTDLLRRDGLLTPEFIESQYENPAFPLQRCTIYDAGSRAFWLPEYLEDLEDYWGKTLDLATGNMDFDALLRERAPDICGDRFQHPDLKTICRLELEKCEVLQRGMARPKSS